jgi:hypothetical protein
MATSITENSDGVDGKTEHLDYQVTSLDNSALDDTWTEESLLWIHLYHDLLFAATSRPSRPIIFASSAIVHEAFSDYFKRSLGGPGIDLVRPKTRRSFQLKRNAIVPEKILKVDASLPDTIMGDDSMLIKRITIRPKMLEGYKNLRGTQNLDEELILPGRHAALWNFVNDALCEQHPDLYPPSASRMEAPYRDVSELPRTNSQLETEGDTEQAAPTHSQENPMLTTKTPTPPPQKVAAIPSLLIKFKNIEAHHVDNDDKVAGWQKRSAEEELRMERVHHAADIDQPSPREEASLATSVLVARSTRQKSFTLNRATRRKAAVPTDNQPPAKRSKTAPPAAKKAAAKARIHQPKNPNHPDSVDDYPMEGIVTNSDESASAAMAGDSQVKSSDAEPAQLIEPTPRIKGEEFSNHPTKPDFIIARFKYQLAGDDTEYELVDEIPKQRDSSTTKKQQTKARETYLLPDLKNARINSGKNKGTWIKPANGSSKWTRGGEEWSPTVLIRRFDSQTHEYLSVNTMHSHLNETIDPNNRDWRQRFNKALDQIRQRNDSDYTIKVTKVTWTDEERQALYKSINKWCRKKGVDNFSLEKGKLDLRQLADDINADCSALHQQKGYSRSHDMVRSQIRHAIESTSKNFEGNPIRILANRAQEMKQSVDKGVEFPCKEQFPDEAIPLKGIAKDVEEDAEESETD